MIVQVSFNKQKKKMVIRFHDLPTIPYQDLDSCSGQPQSKVAQVIFVGQISSSHNFFPRSRSFLFCMKLWSYRKRQQFHFSRFFQYVKFIYSDKATKFCEISTVDLTVTTQDKSTMEISQKCVAFSEYMNFKR